MALRFKKDDGSDYPEWEQKKLGDVCNIYSGSDNKSHNGIYPIYGANGLIGYCEYYSFNTPLVVLGRVGTAGKANYYEGLFSISDNVLIIQNNISRINTKFLYYLLLEHDFSKYTTQTSQPLLTGSNCKKTIFFFPLLEEQEKIATLLSNLDDLIYKIEDKLDTLKKLKKSLMQQLFKKD